jgi:hypothetical protein
MATIITTWRDMVADPTGAVWDDSEALSILDAHRLDFYAHPLTARGQNESGTVVYKVFETPLRNIEGTAGTAYPVTFRMFDSGGNTISGSAYSADFLNGRFVFTDNQGGSVRLIDASTFDLNAAAAAGWRQLAGAKASLYSFTADGASFSRSDWFRHCKEMHGMYSAARGIVYVPFTRVDVSR